MNEIQFNWSYILILVVGVLFFMGIFYVYDNYYTVYVKQSAQTYCLTKGYDIYTEYTSRFFDKKAYAIKCGYMDYSKKRIDVNITPESKTSLIIS